MKRLLIISAAIITSLIAQAIEPDYRGEPFREIRAQYLKSLEKQKAKRVADLKEFIEKQSEANRQRGIRAKIARNETAIADAEQAAQIYQSALNGLARRGTFVLPDAELIRTRIAREIALLGAKLASADQALDNAKVVLENNAIDKLRPLLEAAGCPVLEPGYLQKQWQILLEEKQLRDAGEKSAAIASPAAGSGASAASAEPVANAPAKAIFRVDVQGTAYDIVSIPIVGIAAPRTFSGESIPGRTPCTATVTPIKTLANAPAPNTVFTLVPIEGKKCPELATRPRSGNRWTLELRLTSGGKSSCYLVPQE